MRDQLPAQGLLDAIDTQLNWFANRTDYQWDIGERTISAADMHAALTTFRELYQRHGQDPVKLQEQLQEHFDLYRFTFDESPEILVTGYHAPIYAGSRQPSETYRWPLYSLPPDLIYVQPDAFAESVLRKGTNSRRKRIPARLSGKNVKPYFSREEIDGQQALAGKGLELVYLKDYFQAFSFHVQGGGFVRLPNGRLMKFNYAGSNGHPYVSIGRLMVESGKIPKEEISMQALAARFAQFPEELMPTCFGNPSYVFYTSDGKDYAEILPDMFPHGVLGFPVTTRRSIATDKRYFPGGALAYITGNQKALDGSAHPFSAFVLDQDTGGAIRNGHIDWFLGAGSDAEHHAGLLNEPNGRVYFLLLKMNASATF